MLVVSPLCVVSMMMCTLQGVADGMAGDASETHASVALENSVLCLRAACVHYSACVLQGVADGLAVDAYETHARVALESNDLPEFRQCLARLKQLYRAGVSDAVRPAGWWQLQC